MQSSALSPWCLSAFLSAASCGLGGSAAGKQEGWATAIAPNHRQFLLREEDMRDVCGDCLRDRSLARMCVSTNIHAWQKRVESLGFFGVQGLAVFRF